MSHRCVQQSNRTAAMMYRFMHVTQRRASQQLGSDELQIHHTGGDESGRCPLEKLELGAVLFGTT